MIPVVIRPWFKPHAFFDLDGVRFATNGPFALAAAVPETGKELPGEPIRKYLAAERVIAAEVRERGFVLFDGLTFAGHAVNLIAAAYPCATWSIGGDRECGWAIARVDGAFVGLLMCIIPRCPDEVCGAPACPTCEGFGGPECPACGGAGEVECCHCGHDTACRKCNGTGVTSRCVGCKGSKVWTVAA